MIYETGTETSLLNIITAFISFCQTSNDTTDAWTLIHNNVNSFEGTTFRCAGLENDSYAYISFSYRDITSTTYPYWYNGDDLEYMSEGYKRSGTSGTTTTIIRNKNGTDNTTLNTYYENIFADTGSFVSFNVHKQYSDGLYMCEQGGGYRPSVDDMDLLKCHVLTYVNGTYTGYTKNTLPLYPGIGYPMLCIADDDINASSVLRYWFTRTNHNATIVIYLDGIWQCISFGLFSSIDTDTYKFPAYICGGSSGIKPSIWVYTIPSSSTTSYTSGNLITLSCKYHGLSTCTPINTSKMNSTPANFLIMSNDGTWSDYYNNIQTSTVGAYYTSSGHATNWGIYLNEPTKSIGHNSIIPCDVSCDDLYSTSKLASYYSIVNTKDDIQLYPVMPYKNTDDYKGILGFIDNMYALFSDKIDYGTVVINSSTYLVIPCGWINRQVYYQSHLGVYTEWNIDSISSTVDTLNKVKLYKIAIKLE